MVEKSVGGWIVIMILPPRDLRGGRVFFDGRFQRMVVGVLGTAEGLTASLEHAEDDTEDVWVLKELLGGLEVGAEVGEVKGHVFVKGLGDGAAHEQAEEEEIDLLGAEVVGEG